MRAETRIARAALTEARQGEPMHAGPVFATAFHTPGDAAEAAYSYARSAQPTWTALEEAIAVLECEDARVRVFASGLAAVGAVFAVTLRPRDVVVLPEEVYFGAREVLGELFVSAGVEVRAVATERLGDRETLQGARLLWLETPSNPRLSVTDIEAVAEQARALGVLVAVDNTTATPWLQQPLALGADFSVCSGSKSLCGHSDLLLGHVAVRDDGWLSRLDRHRTLAGAALGPMEAWLALRSLPTLALRMERSCSNALRLARCLLGRPEICEVLYPGLPGHPGHTVAARQMRGFGAVLSFTLRSAELAQHFLARAQLVTEATSFGGVTTTAERRARWGRDAVAPGLLRLSAGCEDPDDLVADVLGALEGLP